MPASGGLQLARRIKLEARLAALPMAYPTFGFAVRQLATEAAFSTAASVFEAWRSRLFADGHSGKEFKTLCRVVEVLAWRSAKDATNQ